MTHRTTTIWLNLSDLEGHLSITSLFKRDFSYSCTVVNIISTAVARRAVPLR